MLTGDNGIINQTINANKQTDIAGTREQIEIELMARYDTEGNYTNNDVIEAVKTVTGQDIEEGTETVTTDKGNEVDISDLWGEIIEKISTTESYVGYYADMDADGTVDGVIYADLAIEESGTYNGNRWGAYSYSATTGLKDYYVSQESYEDDFGTKAVLSPVERTTGNDRFYIMALDDVGSYNYYWYYSAYDNLDSSYSVEGTINDFGEGKANTIRMIKAWNNETYGIQNGGGTNNPDLWGLIQDRSICSYSIITRTDDSGKWFVPSKAEWAAFGDYLWTKLGVTTSTKKSFGISDFYWSSTQVYDDEAFGVLFYNGMLPRMPINTCQKVTGSEIGSGSSYCYYVRLSSTF